MQIYSLKKFFNNIKNRVLLSFKNNNFDKIQVSLLEESFNLYEQKSINNLYGTSIAIFYFIAKSYKQEFDEQAELLGTFCTLYVMSLDLFDDVQDNDLAGKPYEKIGPSIAINNALALLFLAIEFLIKAINLEKDNERKKLYLDIFNKASITAIKGQHLDLMGLKNEVKNINQVFEIQKNKTASSALIAGCAAIYSDCSEEEIKSLKEVSEEIVQVYQVVDDIRDIFGKKYSPDLMTDKLTSPIAFFYENSEIEQIKTFENLKLQLPQSIKEIRNLLYESGAVLKCSEYIEKLRIDIHNKISLAKGNKSSLRVLLDLVDTLAGSIYKIQIQESTKHILQPDDEWSRYLRKTVNSFFYDMKNFNPPQTPELVTWHLSYWSFDTKTDIVNYPDLEGSPDEVLEAQSEFMNIDDLDTVKDIIKIETPFIMAHELFHYWRKKSNKLTDDYWYEEWVANNLAIAYLRKFLPDLYNETLINSQRLLDNFNSDLSDNAKSIISRFSDNNYLPDTEYAGYDVNLNEMTFIQMSMINKISENSHDLNNLVDSYIN